MTFEPHEINGRPGAIFRDRDGQVLHTLVLDVLDGQIQTIRTVINPDKLGRIGPVADAWAVDREVKQTRQRPNRPQEGGQAASFTGGSWQRPRGGHLACPARPKSWRRAMPSSA